MLTPPEAARTILEHVAPLPTERRPLKEALDLVLAEDVISPIDLPGWDNRKNIRHRGEDIRTGAVALATGTALGPAQLGVLASIAHAAPLVHRPPRVAFLGSGDEIVDLDHADEILAGTKIATSNSYTLFGSILRDRKSTRLNSSHRTISYAVFCLKKKTKTKQNNIKINYL